MCSSADGREVCPSETLAPTQEVWVTLTGVVEQNIC